ncbi:TPA: restriction endonuclease subunit S [Citrobacter braakii]|nr:restriction endonuclease subunit S [Citrobacter freundii]HEE9906512.1 restriction endonuclease subunit S [Citrobacter freundii]HEE9934640.1 restriction endonuclease subunit S [Citrobacter braakii]HEF0053457.1 restriction endonuclease subunit S [Citrobacter braakii]
MQFKEYPSYKNSGVEWLGDVPSDWHVKRFGYIFSENKTKNRGLIENNVLSLSYGNIKEKNVEDNKGLLPESFETYQLIEPNDIIFRFTDLQNDKRSLRSAISNYKGIITSAYISVRTRQNAEYFNYLFRAYDLQKVYYSMGDGMRQSLKIDELNRMPITVPNQQIQTQIANYLDQETQKIDTLIAKQEKLIELLEEQRKSVISHAVTKGLDPNAPMKDSGVEWLGDVPSHWNFTRIDGISKIVRGNSAFAKADLLEAGQYIALQYGRTYKVDEINTSFNSYVNQEFFKDTQVANFQDVILISTSETLEDLGHSCFYALHNLGLIGGEQFLLKPKAHISGKYLYYATKAFSNFLQRYATGLKVFRFNLDDLKNIHIPNLSLEEQERIVCFVDQQTIRIDTLIQKQKSLIEKLKEYRASIISHAVTGKIDVRELVA